MAAIYGAHRDVCDHLARISSQIELERAIAERSGFIRQTQITLSTVDNPQRAFPSAALLPVESVWIENPTPTPILVGFDTDATPAAAQVQLPGYRARMFAVRHEMLSLGIDPAITSELETFPQAELWVVQYDRCYPPSSMQLAPVAASVVTPQTVSLADTGVHQAAQALPAASVLLQAKDTNTSPVAYGTPSTLAIGSDAGVWGRLTAGQSTVLDISNTNMVAFQTGTAPQVVYVTALR